MAIENAKNLNVRIKNKYDSYENWAASGLVLEAGEIAIAYSTVDVKVDNGSVKHPFLLMKVGDGEKTFANLPWLSAKAADVLEACKSETGLTAFVNTVIANAGIASDDAMQELAGKVTAAEGEIDALQADLDTAETGLKARMGTAEAAIEAIEAKFGQDTVALEIDAAIAALKLAETYAAKVHEHTKADITDFAHNHEMSEINGLADEFAKKVDKVTGKSLVADTEIARLAAMSDGANKVEASETNGKIKIDGVETVVYTHPAEHAMTEITGLGDALASKQDVIPANTYDAYGAAATALEDANEYTDAQLEALVGTDTVAVQIATNLENALKVEKDGAKVDKYALATDLAAEIEAARAAEKANADAIEVLNGDASTNGSVSKKIADAIATLVDNPDEAMNSIQELVDWTTEHAKDALEMSNQVTANKNAIATLNGDASTAGSVDKKIADAISGENLAQYAKAADLEDAVDRIDVIEGDLNAENTGLKARMTQAESDIDALEDLVGDKKVSVAIEEAIEACKTDASNKDAVVLAEAQKGIAAVQAIVETKANDADLAAIAKTGSTDDLVQGAMVLVFDCGGADV